VSRKSQRRERHRVEREVEEAWQALEDGELALAARLARRAREAGAVNPRVLHDCGRILLACGDADEAEAALREAIRLAPNYADAFAALAELQAKLHRMTAATRLQAKVVELEPGNEIAQRRLAAWKAAAGAQEADGDEPAGGIREPPAEPSPRVVAFARRLADRAALRKAMMQRGWSVLRGVLDGSERAELLAAYAAQAGFSQEFLVPYEQRQAGYRWLFDPGPESILALREAVWPCAFEDATCLHAMVGKEPDWPVSLAELLAAARARGVRPETGRIVHLEAGAILPPQRLESRAAFPVRAVVDLGGGAAAAADDATLVLTDRRPGKKVRSQQVRTDPGDLILFCGRDRLVLVGDTLGWQPVTFAFGPFAADRWLLDLSFDGDR
jgi:hypothetical protein